MRKWRLSRGTGYAENVGLQVSESKDAGGSRSYAISLYEEVARVHGKTIIPMIGRVMRTMTGALSGNGSSPQLHEACAKVAAALVRYTIDSESSAAEAEDILKDVSRPLVDLLTGTVTLFFVFKRVRKLWYPF